MWARETADSTFTCFIATQPQGWRLTLTINGTEALVAVVHGEEAVFSTASAWLHEWCDGG
jgi:hypothetical protein